MDVGIISGVESGEGGQTFGWHTFVDIPENIQCTHRVQPLDRINELSLLRSKYYITIRKFAIL